MAADDASPIRWFVDESMLAIGKALAAVRHDVVYPGHLRCTIARGAEDEHWLSVVGANGWAVLMRDQRIRYRRPERERLVSHGVRAFCLTGAGNRSRWDMLRDLVTQWDQLASLAAVPGPFIVAVTQRGVRRIEL